MKTSSRVWGIIKSNWDTILIMAIIAIIAPLSFMQKVDQQLVSTAILSTLFLLAYNLLISRETNSRLQKTAESILSRIEKPSADEVIYAYKEWTDEIESALATAKEVWIFSRTCVTFWEDYSPQLKGILERKGSIRLMLVDPSNGALKMIAKSATFMRSRELSNGQFSKVTAEGGSNRLLGLRARVDEFIEYITNYKLQLAKGELNLRTIDYLPSSTLVIVNGRNGHGVIFVELGTFQANKHNRPTFFLDKSKNKELYSLYMNEYETMWESAKAADVIVTHEQ
ncbi:MAG: hypothetical protein QM730_22960 [Anaerolineales bacterium]